MSSRFLKIGLGLSFALGIAAMLGCWAWLLGVVGAVSMGAPLRPEWQNWLIILLYGGAPAVLAFLSLGFATKQPVPKRRAAFALTPIVLLGWGPLASWAGFWPIT